MTPSLKNLQKAAGTFVVFKKKIWEDKLTWNEVQVGLGDGGASCHRQMGKSGIKGQVVWPHPHT